MKPFVYLLILALGLLYAASCRFPAPKGPKEAPAPAVQQASPEAGQDEVNPDDAMAVLGKILDGLEKVAQRAVDKGWIDTTRVREAPESAPEPDPEPEPEAPAQPPDEWYDRDFALAFTHHQYALGGARVSSMDFKVYYTRLGDKIYVHKPGNPAEDVVMEYHGDGTRTYRYYMGGIQMKTNRQEGDAHAYLYHQFTDVGNTFNEILGYHPSVSRAQKETTISGRPVAVIHTEKDEDILTQHLHTEKDYYVDKEYGFLYKTVGSGSGGGMSIKNGCTWEVTYFTDKPSKKDIHLQINNIQK